MMILNHPELDYGTTRFDTLCPHQSELIEIVVNPCNPVNSVNIVCCYEILLVPDPQRLDHCRMECWS